MATQAYSIQRAVRWISLSATIAFVFLSLTPSPKAQTDSTGKATRPVSVLEDPTLGPEARKAFAIAEKRRGAVDVIAWSVRMAAGVPVWEEEIAPGVFARADGKADDFLIRWRLAPGTDLNEVKVVFPDKPSRVRIAPPQIVNQPIDASGKWTATDEFGIARFLTVVKRSTQWTEVHARAIVPLTAFSVTNTNDSGPGSLRQAIINANGDTNVPHVITISVPGTIDLQSVLPDITRALTINGPGADQLIVRRAAGGNYRIFTVPSGGPATGFSGMTIRDGAEGGTGGGAIYSFNNVTVNQCVLANNATSGSAGGGILLLGGTHVITNSTFLNNTAAQQGGAINNDAGTLDVINCTISGNTANGGGFGGGVCTVGFAATTTNLTNCTLNGNNSASPTNGVGICNSAQTSTTRTNYRNTIFNGGSPQIITRGGPQGILTSLGNNLCSDGSGNLTAGGDLPNTNPLLAALANNGGPTQTHALLPGSPAIDAGTSTGAPPTDQRGIARVGNVDIGAFESRGFTLTATGGTPQSTPPNTPFPTPLTVSVTSAFGEPVDGGRVTFTPPGSGASCTIAGTPATISAGTATTGTVTANGTIGGPYSVTANTPGATGPATFTLTNACQTITVSPATIPTGTAGTPYSQTFTQTGGIGAVTFSQTGTLPSGISFNPSTATLSGTPTQTGSFNINVTATDSNGCQGTRTYTLTINCQSIALNPPTVPDAAVAVPYNQTFTQTGGIGAVTFSRTGSLPAGLTLNPTTGLLSGTPTQTGTFAFTIVATDQNGCTGSRSYTASFGCSPITLGPVSLAGGTATLPYSQTVTASGGVSPYVFAVASGSFPPGLTLGSSGAITGAPTAAGTFNFTIQATDASGCVGTRAYSIAVCPFITIDPAQLPGGTFGTAYSQQLTASGGTGPYTFGVTTGVLPQGLTLASSGLISGTPIRPTTIGPSGFIVTVADANGCTNTQSYSISLTGGGTSCPPIALAPTSLPSGTVNASYAQTIAASGGTAPYTYAISTGSLPAGLALNAATGAISGSPSASGSFTFTVQATDAALCTGTRSYTLTVSPANCPTFAFSPSPATALTGTVGVAFSQTISVAAANRPTFTITNAPPGLSLSSAGVLSGTPTAAGSFTTTITVTDAVGCTGTATYRVVVCAAIALAPPVLPGGTIGAAYSQTISATGGQSPYTFTVASGALPPGVTLGTNGTLSGTPTTGGSFPFTVEARDAGGCVGRQAYTLTIPAAQATIDIQPATLPAIAVGSPFSQRLTATGGVSPYGFAVTAGRLPAGLSLAGDGLLSGTATAGGQFSFTVTATDARGTRGQRAYTGAIACATITIAPAILPEGVPGSAYSQQLNASGGTAPYTFSVLSGSLPNGLTLSPTGLLSGTPTGGASAAANFTVRARDAADCAGTASYQFRFGCRPFEITPGTLPPATVGAAYSAEFVRVSDNGPLTFALAGGTLPPGLTLSPEGRVSGTPTTAGSFGFQVRGTAGTCQATRDVTLTVRGSVSITRFFPTSAVAGQTIRLTGTGFADGLRVFFGGNRLVPAVTLRVLNDTTAEVVVPQSRSGAGNINGFISVRLGTGATATTQGLPAAVTDPANPQTQTAEFVLAGDVDGDGNVTSDDAAAVAQVVVGLTTPSVRQIRAADVFPANPNGSLGDGRIDALDLAQARAFILGQVLLRIIP